MLPEVNIPVIEKKNKLEESLESLDLESTLVLMGILSQRALYLSTKDKNITKVPKLLKVKP